MRIVLTIVIILGVAAAIMLFVRSNFVTNSIDRVLNYSSAPAPSIPISYDEAIETLKSILLNWDTTDPEMVIEEAYKVLMRIDTTRMDDGTAQMILIEQYYFHSLIEDRAFAYLYESESLRRLESLVEAMPENAEAVKKLWFLDEVAKSIYERNKTYSFQAQTPAKLMSDSEPDIFVSDEKELESMPLITTIMTGLVTVVVSVILGLAIASINRTNKLATEVAVIKKSLQHTEEFLKEIRDSLSKL